MLCFFSLFPFFRTGGVGGDTRAALDLLQPNRKAEGYRRVKEIEGNALMIYLYIRSKQQK